MELKTLGKVTLSALAFEVLFYAIVLTCFAGEVDHTKAVIHHTATKDVDIMVIRRYHVEEKGWKDVGYHALIREDGQVQKGRDDTTKGAHAIGRNDQLGIALTGFDYFSTEQVEALISLLKSYGVKEISVHHEACPSDGLDLRYIRSKL